MNYKGPFAILLKALRNEVVAVTDSLQVLEKVSAPIEMRYHIALVGLRAVQKVIHVGMQAFTVLDAAENGEVPSAATPEAAEHTCDVHAPAAAAAAAATAPSKRFVH